MGELLTHNFAGVLVFLGLIWNGATTLIRKSDEVKGLAEWRKQHEAEAKQRDLALQELKLMGVSLKEIANGQERRIRLLEDRRSEYIG